MVGEIQCFDGDGVRPPPTASTLFAQRVEVLRTYGDRGLVKLRLFHKDGYSRDDIDRAKSYRFGVAYLQIVVLDRNGNETRTSFFDCRTDSVQATYDGMSFRVHYERSEPKIKTYTQQRSQKTDWYMSNP